MNKKIVVVVVVVLAVGAFLLYRAKQRDANNGRILVSGNIEATEVALGFNVAGTVEKRFADEGAQVRQGDIIALLDSNELVQVVAQAEAACEVAKAEAGRARLEFARQRDLLEKKVISAREFEIADAARAVTEANVKQAEASAALARTRLAYATLRTPVKGVVLSKSIEPGEHVVPGTPVVSVADLSTVWLRAYIAETELGRVKLGGAVRVTTDTYPGRIYEGQVAFISSQAEFTPKSVQTPKERVKLVYRIKVDLRNPDQELKPGMPADAEILAK
ncbi:MAG: hemolysin secretion protein D [Verrucomicrobia bacterium]|nr:hemolysin secretion protein D [Verrucomicrobiota bacterium]